MKRIVFTLTIALSVCLMSFTFPGEVTQTQMLNNLVVQFVTTNGYGNNLLLIMYPSAVRMATTCPSAV